MRAKKWRRVETGCVRRENPLTHSPKSVSQNIGMVQRFKSPAGQLAICVLGITCATQRRRRRRRRSKRRPRRVIVIRPHLARNVQKRERKFRQRRAFALRYLTCARSPRHCGIDRWNLINYKWTTDERTQLCWEMQTNMTERGLQILPHALAGATSGVRRETFASDSQKSWLQWAFAFYLWVITENTICCDSSSPNMAHPKS